MHRLVEVERGGGGLHGLLLVAVAVDGLDVLLGLLLDGTLDALEVVGRLAVQLVRFVRVDADILFRRGLGHGSAPFVGNPARGR